MAEIDLGAVVGPKGDTGSKGEKGDQGPQGPQGPSGVVDGNSTIAFTTPTTYEEPVSGNSISVLFGRFKRWVLNLQDNIGSLSSLKTPAKASVVDGVNANYDSIAQLEQDIGNPADLTTTSKEVVGAITELNSALAHDSENYTNSIFENGNCIAEKTGNIVSITLNFTSAQNIAEKTVTQLFTLGEKYKPNSRKIFYFHNGYISYIVIIETSGVVQWQLLSEHYVATTWVYGTCTYLIQ